jgi:phosphate starvation-inducible protein PhoH and related proteins
VKLVQPRTKSQKHYLEALSEHPLVFGVGPAGTGKTYLAAATAIEALRKDEVSRVIISRPAVEAGEKLGFLPGTLSEKVEPYVRPVLDALRDLWPEMKLETLITQGQLEVAPLAYMRGRSLNNAFMMLDEAQNTTVEQMKMFLTRMGKGSRMVVTGDPSQTDLPARVRSGLEHALTILEGVQGIEICEFTAADVQRHPLVRAIVKAYDKDMYGKG